MPPRQGNAILVNSINLDFNNTWLDASCTKSITLGRLFYAQGKADGVLVRTDKTTRIKYGKVAGLKFVADKRTMLS